MRLSVAVAVPCALRTPDYRAAPVWMNWLPGLEHCCIAGHAIQRNLPRRARNAPYAVLIWRCCCWRMGCWQAVSLLCLELDYFCSAAPRHGAAWSMPWSVWASARLSACAA